MKTTRYGLRGTAMASIAIAQLAGLSCGGTAGNRGTAVADRDASTDARTGGATESGVESGAAEGADGGPRAPVTCAWTAGDHAAQCPAPCSIVEDVNVTCNDEYFASPGLRVAPAPASTWLVTSSHYERYAFSIASGQGTTRDGLPADFADQTIALALSRDGQPVLAADTFDVVTIQGDAGQTLSTHTGGTEFEALAPDGWHGSTIDRPAGSAPALALEVASDGTPNVWVGYSQPAGFQRATLGAAGWTLTDAPALANGIGDDLFTLARDGTPVSFDMSYTGVTFDSPLQLHAIIGGVDLPLDMVDVTRGYTVADPPSPTAPMAGPRAAVAILEGDGIHVAGLGAQGWTETVIPSTLTLLEQCGRSNTTACPSTECHETAAGVSPDQNGRGEAVSLGLAWTVDGVAWLAYVVIRIDEQVHFSLQSVDPGLCGETIDSGGESYEVHLTRVPLDGSPAREVLDLPVPTIAAAPSGYTANQAQAVTARWFDLRAFGTDLALGFRTVDANGLAAVRVLRIDTTMLGASP